MFFIHCVFDLTFVLIFIPPFNLSFDHVTDLHDPLQNVKVGVALLCQYFEENDDVYYVLMKYNGGHAYANKMMKAGKVSDYAREITERAIMYERENGI